MFSLFRYKRYGLPHGVITIHELLVRDIFGYFEKGRLVRKKIRHARKAIKGALRFARRKKSYPSKKTTEALNALEQIHDEIEYTHKAIKTAFAEAEDVIKMIRQEKVGDITPLIESARAHFKNHDLSSGMEHLKSAQERLKNIYLPKSRKAILGGLDSDVKQLKHELRERQLSRS
jgi:hypothetical protein